MCIYAVCYRVADRMHYFFHLHNVPATERSVLTQAHTTIRGLKAEFWLTGLPDYWCYHVQATSHSSAWKWGPLCLLITICLPLIIILCILREKYFLLFVYGS